MHQPQAVSPATVPPATARPSMTASAIVTIADLRAAVLAPRGRLTAMAMPPDTLLTSALNARHLSVLVIDLAGICDADPAGLTAVARLADTLAHHGLALRLANPQPAVWMACYLNTQLQHIPTYDSVQAAVLNDPHALVVLQPPYEF